MSDEPSFAGGEPVWHCFIPIVLIVLAWVIRDSYKQHRRQNKNSEDEVNFVSWAVIAVIVASFINAGHGGSVIRPTVSPAIWLLLAAFSVVIRGGPIGGDIARGKPSQGHFPAE
jgi:uncharacterized membrane protein YoaK (UPF0700 family)